MADFVYFNVIQSVQNETSDPTVTHGYDDAGTLKTLELQITRGTFPDPYTGDPVHIMQDSPATGGFTYFMTASGDDADFVSMSIQQEVAPTGIALFDLQQEVAPTGLDFFDIEQIVVPSYTATLNIQQEVITSGNTVSFYVQQSVFTAYTAYFDLSQEVYHQPELAYFGVQQQVTRSGPSSFLLHQTVLPESGTFTSPFYQNSQYWSVKVTLNGTDISALLTGEVDVEAEEGSARLATFTYYPPAGTIDPITLIKQPVTIDHQTRDVSGNVTSQTRLFTGIVDTPEFDVTMGLLTMRCTDDLQGKVEASERDYLFSIIGGYYSEDVFDYEESTNWEYAQDLLSTTPKFLDLDPFGNFRVNSWYAKAAGDLELQDAHLEYRTPTVELGHWRDIINHIELYLDSRFPRLYQREVSMGWKYPRYFCQFLTISTDLVTKDMLYGAVEGLGWGVKSIGTRPLYPSTALICTGGVNGVPVAGTLSGAAIQWNNPYYPDIYLGFSVGIYKRWSQSVTEKYKFNIYAPQTRDVFGDALDIMHGNVSIDFDTEAYENLDAQQEEAENSVNFRDWRGCIADNPDLYSLQDLIDYKAPPDGAVTNILEDYYLDEDDQQRYEDAIKVLFAQARNKILESHRQNYVEFTRPFLPFDLDQTVYVNATRVEARGKVSKLRFVMNIEENTSLVTGTLAISKSTDTAVTEQIAPGGEVAVPARVYNKGYWEEIDKPRHGIPLPTQIGNDVSHPYPYCEDMLGFSTNLQILGDSTSYDVAVRSDVVNNYYAQVANRTGESPQPFPYRLKMEVDEIEDALVQEAEIDSERNLNTVVPNELLNITR